MFPDSFEHISIGCGEVPVLRGIALELEKGPLLEEGLLLEGILLIKLPRFLDRSEVEELHVIIRHGNA